MKVDCHIHSLHSDGIYTVKEIADMLAQRNIQVFSLTDHDTLGGIEEARRLSNREIRFISGIEFTCKEMTIDPIGKRFSIHLLGYHFDEKNLQLAQALDKRAQKVIQVYDDLCSKLTSLGCPVLREEIPVSCGNVLQLCDIAACVREKFPGVKDEVSEMIDSYAAELDNVNIGAEEAVDLIHNAGGKAVWGHPFCVYKDFKKMSLDKEEVLNTLERLREIGVDGIEAHYLAFSDERRKWLQETAEERNMIYTAGSDFHGSAGRDGMGIEIRPHTAPCTAAESCRCIF